MVSGPTTSWQIDGGKAEGVTDFFFWGSKMTADSDCSHEIRRLLLGRKAMTNLDSVWKTETLLCWQRFIQSRLWSSQWSWTAVRAGPWRSRTPKKWCFQAMVMEKTPESLLDSKEIKPVNNKGNQPWIFIGRTNAEAEASVFWLPTSDANSRLIGKVPYAGKDWGQKEKRTSEDEMAGWHHRCNGQELGQILGDSKRQGDQACCSPWDRKESDTAGWLKNTTGKLLLLMAGREAWDMMWVNLKGFLLLFLIILGCRWHV